MKDIIKIFKALSDPTRLRILRLLREQELCVCEIMAILGMEQSRISHQMRVLRDADLVEDIRQGRWIIYRIPDRTREIVEAIFSGKLNERLSDDPKVKEDALKLKECLNRNLRATLCPSGNIKQRLSPKATPTASATDKGGIVSRVPEAKRAGAGRPERASKGRSRTRKGSS